MRFSTDAPGTLGVAREPVPVLPVEGTRRPARPGASPRSTPQTSRLARVLPAETPAASLRHGPVSRAPETVHHTFDPTLGSLGGLKNWARARSGVPLVFPLPRGARPSPVCSLLARRPRQRAELLVRLEIRGSSRAGSGTRRGLLGAFEALRASERRRAPSVSAKVEGVCGGVRARALSRALVVVGLGKKFVLAKLTSGLRKARRGESRKRLSTHSSCEGAYRQGQPQKPVEGSEYISRAIDHRRGFGNVVVVWKSLLTKKKDVGSEKQKASATAPG